MRLAHSPHLDLNTSHTACLSHASPQARIETQLRLKSDSWWLAELVIHWLMRTLDDVALHPLEAEDEEEAQRPLPRPLHKARALGVVRRAPG